MKREERLKAYVERLAADPEFRAEMAALRLRDAQEERAALAAAFGGMAHSAFEEIDGGLDD